MATAEGPFNPELCQNIQFADKKKKNEEKINC